ncbi:hypothetical protein RchiOBHm_Chr7g0239511 [Rosa chinensis]|uniref:Uncharacterized protein n=1 Tax=Rosa chinensis TaxID=74649 RepID=A0A2P6PHQ3_ROSCH|nr:hypothetical protein RchiOBHm_Chr7g0239511 [Rosa chinensis]
MWTNIGLGRFWFRIWDSSDLGLLYLVYLLCLSFIIVYKLASLICEHWIFNE